VSFFATCDHLLKPLLSQRMKQETSCNVLASAQLGITALPVERRKAVRYRWQGSEHSCLKGDGLTRDISATGAYVLAATSPPANALVDVEIYLLGTGERKSRIKTRARVLRVDDSVMASRRLGFSLEGGGFHLFLGQVCGCK
jgi:hypothetical protein